KIDVAPSRSLSIAAERDVKIIAQEPRERHVPAPPEIDQRERFVRRVEIEREAHADHQRQANRHVGIAGKIIVELEREAAHPDPAIDQADWLTRGCRVENRRGILRHDVCEQHFLGKSERKPGQTEAEVGNVEAEIFLEVELRHDFFVMIDRTGNEMREKRDEKRVMKWFVLARLATV